MMLKSVAFFSRFYPGIPKNQFTKTVNAQQNPLSNILDFFINNHLQNQIMLAPDQSVISEFFTNFLTSYQSVTLAAISLRNSQFFPLSPEPDWMKTLDTNLSQAQKNAGDFLITKGQLIVTQVPQYFVSYCNSMEVLSQNIVNASTKQDAIKQLQWLQGHIEEIPASVKLLFASLNSVKATFKSYKDKIDNALKAAMDDIKTDQAYAKEISDQISELLQDISSETVKANNGMTGVITSGTSLSVALLSWSFAVATTLSPAIPVIGVIVAIGGLTFGAITNAVNESHIAETWKKSRFSVPACWKITRQ